MARRRTSSNFLRSFAENKRGSTAVAMAVLTPVIVAGLAFGSEAGTWQMTDRKLQNAADAAVFAAGTQLRSGLSEEEMRVAAITIANDSGFNLVRHDESDSAKIAAADGVLTLYSPPQSGAFAGDTSAIQLALATDVDRRFSKLFVSDPVTIDASATALVQNGRPACVLALHPTASSAVNVSGSSAVTLVGCDAAANSIASDAFAQDGDANIQVECISVVGGVDYNKPANVSLTDPVCPSALENAPVSADPYKNRTFPVDPATLSCTNKSKWKQNNGKPDSGFKYCNGVNVNDRVSVDVDPLNPWIVLDGGNWKFNATADFTAEGVTFYLINGADLDINGGAAPTTGGLAGLAIFIERSQTGSYKFNGGAGIEIVGAIYGASADIEMLGNVESTGAGECAQIIGGTVTFTGTADFDTDCTNSGTTSITIAETIRLVE